MEEEKQAVKPPCSYGSKCYRKNPEHLAKFSHRSDGKRNATNQAKGYPKPKQSRISSYFQSDKHAGADNSEKAEGSGEPQNGDVGKKTNWKHKDATSAKIPDGTKQFIKEKFLFDMPDDFYALWKLAVEIKQDSPCEAFSDAGVRLVGPFDVLAGKFENAGSRLKDSDFLLHWRFYLDPPEFQTVLYSAENDVHLGYLRDDPKELPSVVCSLANRACNWSRLSILGDNLFAALRVLLSNEGKKGISREKAKHLLDKLECAAQRCGFSLEANSQKVKNRKKLVVAPTIHGAGIVVPVKHDVGYRELPETNASLKKMLTVIGESEDDKELQSAKMDKLQEIITYVQFANDECDYGMGLELGVDLFNSGCDIFHKQIQQLLSVAYLLLGRHEFSKILEAHLANRKKGEDLSVV